MLLLSLTKRKRKKKRERRKKEFLEKVISAEPKEKPPKSSKNARYDEKNRI